MCPWNVRFSQALPADSMFASGVLFRDAGSPEGTHALAREILMMKPKDYAAAFKGSAIKRAKLWMLQGKACVVLGNIGTVDDLAVLEAMQSHEHAVVREQAAWALNVLTASRPVAEIAD